MILKIYLIIAFCFFIFFMKYSIKEQLRKLFNNVPLYIFITELIVIIILSLIWPFILLMIFLMMSFNEKPSRFLLFFIILGLCFTSDLDLNSKKFFIKYQVVENQYDWINLSLYEKIYVTSKINKLDSLLICSLINSESNGKQYATSKVKARGYMQIMPCHYKKNPKKLYDPNLNLYCGCNYLKSCLKHSNNNLFESLRKYNQGISGNRKKYKNWKYVKKILNHYTTMIIEESNEKSRFQM